MSRFTEIRSALAAALPDDLDTLVLTGPQEAAKAFGGALGPPRMLVRVHVGNPADPDAQNHLDRLLDPEDDESVPAALLADQTLGGLVRGLQIVGASGWRIWQSQNGDVLGAEWTVQTL